MTASHQPLNLPEVGESAPATDRAPSAPLVGLLPNLNDPRHTPFHEAARGIHDPVAEREAAIEAANAEGYQRGYRDGNLAARSADRDVAENLTALLAATADQVSRSAQEQVAAQATDLADAAWQLACWAIGRELTLDPAALTSAVSAAVAEIDASTTLVVYAHPDANAALTSWVTGHSPHTIDLRPDTSLAVGELRVEAATGARVEATISEIGRRALARLVGTTAAADRPEN